VKIGEQVWMAENLDYAGKNRDLGACYDKKPENCRKYGALYDLREIFTNSSDFTKAFAKQKNWEELETNICPTGWHLPNNEEWEILLYFANIEENAGAKLKAKTGWDNLKNRRGEIISGNGTDNYGFTALANGSNWWSASSSTISLKNYGYIGASNQSLNNVRCVKDDPNKAAKEAAVAAALEAALEAATAAEAAAAKMAAEAKAAKEAQLNR
jgi:uncharacterized protein (TIGR02145 family)